MARPSYRRILAGAIAAMTAGALSWYPALLILQHGYVSTFLIGASSGIGGRWFGGRDLRLAAFTSVLTFIGSVMCYWRFAPFIADRSLQFYFRHLLDLDWVILLDIVFGTYLGFHIVSHSLPDDSGSTKAVEPTGTSTALD